MEEEENPDEEIVRYGKNVIAMHWAVVLVFIPLAATGALLARDWFLETFNIFGGDLLIGTPDSALAVHVGSGIALAILGIVHIMMHMRQKEKAMLPKVVTEEFKETLNTLMYVTFISRQKEGRSSLKYKANQRMSYLATFYTLALAAVTAVFIGTIGEAGSAVHVVAGALVAFLALFRILYLIREWDPIATKCIFKTGTMPLWYVKENHYLWYVQLKGDPEAPAEEPEAPKPEAAAAAD
jgi:cytochrome b561